MKNDIETTIAYFQDSANYILFYLSVLDIYFKDEEFNRDVHELQDNLIYINEYIEEHKCK